MDLTKYVQIILSHKKIILILTIVTTIVVSLGGLVKTPVYKADTTVFIKPEQSGQQLVTTARPTYHLETMLIKGNTYSRILKSKTIAEGIVTMLMLDKSEASANQRKKSGIVAFFKKIIDLPIKLMNFIRYGKTQRIDPSIKLINEIQSSLSISLQSQTSILRISAVRDDPVMASDIANAASTVFIDYMKTANSAEARTLKEFIADRVKVAEIDLVQAQDAYLQFIQEERSVDPGTATDLLHEELIRYESILMNTQAEIDQLRKNIDVTSQKLSVFDKHLKSSITTIMNPVIKDLRLKLANLEIQKASLPVDFGPKHPNIMVLNEEIEEITEKLKTETEKIVDSEITIVDPIYQNLYQDIVTSEIKLSVLHEKSRAIFKIIQSFIEEMIETSKKRVKYDNLVSAVTFYQNNLDSLRLQLETARIKEAEKISEIRVIDRAIPPLGPTGLPKTLYPILGIIVGLVSGIGLAFLIDHVDDSVKSAEMVETELNLPVYGVIPEITVPKKGEKKEIEGRMILNSTADIEEKLITHFEPKSYISEAYRSFRTNIQFISAQKEIQTLSVTSSFKGEGKTSVASNLGIVMANLGKRICLVDGDLRNSMLHKIFKIRQNPGLSNFLVNKANKDEIIMESGIENLHIIPSGPFPPNPSEILSSKNFDVLIEQLKNDHDFIIVDSPPIIAVTDPAIISSKVSGVFLVIKEGKTSKRVCLKALDHLEKVNANVVGAVLNFSKKERRLGYGYYYPYPYGEEK